MVFTSLVITHPSFDSAILHLPVFFEAPLSFCTLSHHICKHVCLTPDSKAIVIVFLCRLLEASAVHREETSSAPVFGWNTSCSQMFTQYLCSALPVKAFHAEHDSLRLLLCTIWHSIGVHTKRIRGKASPGWGELCLHFYGVPGCERQESEGVVFSFQDTLLQVCLTRSC